ncbi:MAG: OsmC family protein [Gemmatimonadetes bacterium]|nr:OsmC family protein [Gemmatimonadota bacterium]
MNASGGALTADVHGEVEKDEGVLMIRKIHVVYRLKAGEEDRKVVERAHEIHAERCPVYRSIYTSIDITTECQLDN